jgi:hypothetical protein
MVVQLHIQWRGTGRIKIDGDHSAPSGMVIFLYSGYF